MDNVIYNENHEIVYFNSPTQVSFVDTNLEPEDWMHLGGIAYQDRIICGCCGGVLELTDINEDWRNLCAESDPAIVAAVEKFETPIRVYDDWVDISEEIIGEEV